MDQTAARGAAEEVLATHKKDVGSVGAYLAEYFPKTWAHFDVNESGLIEVIKMPQFMRFLASDQYMSL